MKNGSRTHTQEYAVTILSRVSFMRFCCSYFIAACAVMFKLFNQPVFFVGKPSKDKDSPDYVPSIFVLKGTKLNQKFSRYERFLARKTQRITSEHGEEHGTSSTAHCGEVSDSEQCRSDGVESLNATVMVTIYSITRLFCQH